MQIEELYSLLLVMKNSSDEKEKSVAFSKICEFIYERYKDALKGYLWNVRHIGSGSMIDGRDLIMKSIMNLMLKIHNGKFDPTLYKTPDELIKAISSYLYKTVDGLAKNEINRQQGRYISASRLSSQRSAEHQNDGGIEDTWRDVNSENAVIDRNTNREYNQSVQSVVATMNSKYAAIILLLMKHEGDPPKEEIKLLMDAHKIPTHDDYLTAKSRALKALQKKLDFLGKIRKVSRDQKRTKNEKNKGKPKRNE